MRMNFELQTELQTEVRNSKLWLKDAQRRANASLALKQPPDGNDKRLEAMPGSWNTETSLSERDVSVGGVLNQGLLGLSVSSIYGCFQTDWELK